MYSMRILASAAALSLVFVSSAVARPDFDPIEINVDQQLASLPLPPEIEPISPSAILAVSARMGVLKDRSAYLSVIVQEANSAGVPPDLADAVVRIESRYNPTAVGRVGEIGLMQLRPKTAAFLGFEGSPDDLAAPEANIRLGIRYLAKAWRLANGDVCRALMKYRAGHQAETMSSLSIEYCHRARLHLAAIGSGLVAQAEPFSQEPIQVRGPRVEPKLAPKQMALATVHLVRYSYARLRVGRVKRHQVNGSRVRQASRAGQVVRHGRRAVWAGQLAGGHETERSVETVRELIHR
jgi:hypothetical protein